MELRKEWMLPVGIGAVSFAAGATAGYIWGKRKGSHITVYQLGGEPVEVEVKTEEQIEHDRLLSLYDGSVEATLFDQDEETEETRDPIAEQRAIEDAIMVERADSELEKIREAHANGAGKFNIFDGDENDWSYELEIPKRDPTQPYIIHRDEFEANEMGFSQSNLTYYALDDILCDDNDVPIYNYQNIVGVLEFGKGSMDISICYVRNEKLGSEWEIIIDQGSFQVEVLGEKIEEAFEEKDIKHSRHPRRFREED